jgi:hypothetical protein
VGAALLQLLALAGCGGRILLHGVSGGARGAERLADSVDRKTQSPLTFGARDGRFGQDGLTGDQFSVFSVSVE